MYLLQRSPPKVLVGEAKEPSHILGFQKRRVVRSSKAVRAKPEALRVEGSKSGRLRREGFEDTGVEFWVQICKKKIGIFFLRIFGKGALGPNLEKKNQTKFGKFWNLSNV